MLFKKPVFFVILTIILFFSLLMKDGSMMILAAPDKTAVSTNKQVSSPKTEDEKQKQVLEQFVKDSDETLIKQILKKFNISDKGSLEEQRKALLTYLGLTKVLADKRKKAEIRIKDIFKSPDLNKNFVIYADEGVHIRSKKDPESGIITIRGEMGNLYIKYKNRLISARLIKVDLKRNEVFGEGNAMLKEKGRIIIGDKFYFNSKTKHGVVYNARTYIKPYFYFGKKIKKIGDKGYIMEDGWFSTSDADPPHYRFGVSKVWLYQDLRLVALDVSYQVSDYPLFPIPFLYHPMSGTGFHTGLGRDTRVGWFMQIANFSQFFSLPIDLTFDYYQKLGIASIGRKNIKTTDWSLDIKYGIAYDKPLQLSGSGAWVNTVDGNPEVPDTGLYGDWKRELRWKFDVNQKLRLYHDTKNKKSGHTDISFNFDIKSDLSFESDFERYRVKNIDIEKLLKRDEITFFNQGAPSGRTWRLAVSDKRGGSTLNLSADWVFRYIANPDSKNTFANDAYIYKKSSITLPKVSYGFSGTILSSVKAISTNTNTSSTNAAGKTNVSPSKKTGSGVDILYLDEKSSQKLQEKKNLVNYSLSYNASIGFDQLKRYSDQDESLIEQRYNRTLSISIPGSLSIGIFKVSMSFGLRDTDQWGSSGLEITNTQQDILNHQYAMATKTDITESFSIGLSHSANKGKITEFGFNFSAGHSLGYTISDIVTTGNQYNKLHRNSLSFSASLNFFKTSIRTSAAYDLSVLQDETRSAGRDRFTSSGPISISFSPFSFMSISESYNFSIKNNNATGNTLGLSFNFGDFRLPLIEKISGLKFGINWNHNYNSIGSGSITFSMSFNAKINDLWKLAFNLNSKNNKLYLYSQKTAALYGQESKNFFTDLAKSLMFWDTDALKESDFKIQSFGFTLTHDLHEWELKMAFQANQTFNNLQGRHFSYFNLNFNVSITMRPNIGIKYPDQHFKYAPNVAGEYESKLNP